MARRVPKTVKEMLPHAEEAAELLRALANEQRLMILCNLTEGELSVGELNERLPLSQSALSQHLAVLRDRGAVITRREAQTVYYALKPGPAARVVATLHQIYCA
jgi:DNA-binding transcriptional ArsR family regulator